METPFLGPFDLHKCIYVGRNISNPMDIVMFLKETGIKGHTWLTLKMLPEDNVDFWLVFLAKVLLR